MCGAAAAAAACCPCIVQCSAGPSTPKVWSLSVSPKELQDTLGQAGRDVLAVVQDMSCYSYTATKATQPTQMGEWRALFAQLPAQRSCQVWSACCVGQALQAYCKLTASLLQAYCGAWVC
jgi:hypothetical protein